MTEKTYIRDLDLWQYEMPRDALTQADINKAGSHNVMIVEIYWDNRSVLVGTWHNLECYMTDYLGYEMNADYLHPLYVGLNDEPVDGCDSDY